MRIRSVVLVALGILIGLVVGSRIRDVVAASLKLTAKTTQAIIANGATGILVATTSPGADCTAKMTYIDGSNFMLTPLHQHVGSSGTVSWKWVVKTTASSGEAFVSCQLQGQGRGATADFTIKGRHDLAPSARPVPSRPRIAVLGATKAAWAEIFGPYLKTSTDDNQGWQACFAQGITPRLSAVFREGHANMINGAFCTDNPPTLVQRATEAELYFPRDYTYVGKYTKSDGSGVDEEFFSPSLARQFVRGDFMGCDMNLVRAGTFSLSLAIESAEDWLVQLGTCA